MQDGNLSEWVKCEQAVQWPPASFFSFEWPRRLLPFVQALRATGAQSCLFQLK